MGQRDRRQPLMIRIDPPEDRHAGLPAPDAGPGSPSRMRPE
jgi:hypothetical protein